MTIKYHILDQHCDAISYLPQLNALSEKLRLTNGMAYLYPPTEAAWQKRLGPHHTKVLAFDDQQLIGFTALEHLQQWPSYLINHQQSDDPTEVGIFTVILLDPQYRNQGLGKAIFQQLYQATLTTGLKCVYSTAHPNNTASIKLLTDYQLQCVYHGPLFDEGLLRKIMYRCLDD